MMFDDNLERRAFLLACEAHKHQRYGEHPYLVHLFDVQAVLRFEGFDAPELLAAGWLHDVIEDTPLHFSAVEKVTNHRVAEIVYACTDELGRNRRERQMRSLDKLREWTAKNGLAALQLKLADWAANVRQSLRDKEQLGAAHFDMYQKDWAHFSALLAEFPDPSLVRLREWLEYVFIQYSNALKEIRGRGQKGGKGAYRSTDNAPK